MSKSCDACGGSGVRDIPLAGGSGVLRQSCPACGGLGRSRKPDVKVQGPRLPAATAAFPCSGSAPPNGSRGDRGLSIRTQVLIATAAGLLPLAMLCTLPYLMERFSIFTSGAWMLALLLLLDLLSACWLGMRFRNRSARRSANYQGWQFKATGICHNCGESAAPYSRRCSECDVSMALLLAVVAWGLSAVVATVCWTRG
jgi:hypothetical protein